jgi:hypothetical protein
MMYFSTIGMLGGLGCSAIGQAAGRASERSPAQPVCLSVLVPSYFSPSSSSPAWNTLLTPLPQSAKVARNVILNPNSGPGKNARADFRKIASKAKKAGIKVYGYVSTRYGKVDARVVQEEVREYIEWYGVDGIFVDEVSAEASEVARYYQPLATYITSKIERGGVILNAGTYPDPKYAEIKVPKQSTLQIVVFENSYASFMAGSYAVPGWVRRYPASKFIHIVYNVPAKDVTKVLQLTAKRGAGTVYVTDQIMPNPYGVLPSYWGEFNRAVEAGCER